MSWPADDEGPVAGVDRTVPDDWTDYNGHMNEARYLQAFSDATDRLMERLGVDAAYLAAGGSFFTVETHIRHLGECRARERIRVETLCLGGSAVKLHLFHLLHGPGGLAATGEQMLLHVSLATRRVAPARGAVLDRVARLAAAHRRLDRPEGIGRAIGQPP